MRDRTPPADDRIGKMLIMIVFCGSRLRLHTRHCRSPANAHRWPPPKNVVCLWTTAPYRVPVLRHPHRRSVECFGTYYRRPRTARPTKRNTQLPTFYIEKLRKETNARHVLLGCAERARHRAPPSAPPPKGIVWKQRGLRSCVPTARPAIRCCHFPFFCAKPITATLSALGGKAFVFFSQKRIEIGSVNVNGKSYCFLTPFGSATVVAVVVALIGVTVRPLT